MFALLQQRHNRDRIRTTALRPMCWPRWACRRILRRTSLFVTPTGATAAQTSISSPTAGRRPSRRIARSVSRARRLRYGVRSPARFVWPRPSRSETRCTSVPLKFDPSGSLLVVFRTPTDVKESHGQSPEFEPVQTIGGPWSVAFDPKWGEPEAVRFDGLVDWTKRWKRASVIIRARPFIARRLRWRRRTADGCCNLGRVKDMAEVRLNGRRLGVVWCPPWRIEITDAVGPARTTWK